MFSRRLSLSQLIEQCRVLRHYLGAGLTLQDVFRQQAKRGSATVRPLATRISGVLEEGDSLEEALKREPGVFPPLFVSLASVGERTGMLPEIFSELERYFLRQKQMRDAFLARIIWPVIQFVLATFVLAGLIYVMGQLTGPSPTGGRFDPLGLGLFGGSGALLFLGAIYGTLGAVFLVYFTLKRLLGGKATVDRFLLRMPALGPCLESLALGRFCLALQLTTEAGMSISKALRLALRATSNTAYASAFPVVEDAIDAGDDVTEALGRTGLFPDDLLRIVHVAEESGTLSEVMKHQGDHYHEEASRRLAILTNVAGYGIWAMIGLFIIVAIFRIYGSYLNLLNSF
ncbi:MAG: type II secretion system F family protein [Gemmataceae bacterium]